MVSDDLKWMENATKAAQRANNMLGQLKWSINFWDLSKLKNLYTSYVRPHLEYASPVCSPFRVKDIKILEDVQRRATKLVPELKNLEYHERLIKLGLTTLVERRIRGDAIQYYKLENKVNKVNWYHPNSLMNNLSLDVPSSRVRGTEHRLARQFTRNCTPREFFFSNRIVPVWNMLPKKVIKAKSVNDFKNLYDKFKSD